MPADRPRAWQYMGAGGLSPGHRFLQRGEFYIATEPLTPDDVPLAPPVEVTADMLRHASFDAWHRTDDPRPWGERFATAVNERLAARQEGE